MKYKSAYIIIITIGVVLFLSTMYGIYKLGNNFWLMASLENEKARITECKSKYFGGSGSRGTRQFGGTKYTPIAYTLSGKKITGSVYVSSDSCRENVGNDVTVLVNLSMPNGGHINTFTQFWLKYVALTFGTLLANVVFIYPFILGIKKMQNA